MGAPPELMGAVYLATLVTNTCRVVAMQRLYTKIHTSGLFPLVGMLPRYTTLTHPTNLAIAFTFQ
ncbi:MAG: hypothetical protein ICV78_21425 [Tolypothrix sp. Co-bin9]|nr:hypothetical protein [Tolypothrix sp. Co-bin9]